MWGQNVIALALLKITLQNSVERLRVFAKKVLYQEENRQQVVMIVLQTSPVFGSCNCNQFGLKENLKAISHSCKSTLMRFFGSLMCCSMNNHPATHVPSLPMLTWSDYVY